MTPGTPHDGQRLVRVGSADDLPAYRIQWRPMPSMGWQYMTDVDGHDDALVKAAAMRSEWGGQTRVLTQHVIETSAWMAKA